MFVEAAFHNIDQFAAAGRGWNQTYRQLRRGPFRGESRLAHTSSVQIGLVRFSPGILIRGDSPPGCVVFAISIAPESPPRHHGRVLGDDEIATTRHGEEIDFQVTSPCTLAVVSIAEEIADEYALAIWGGPLSANCDCSRLRMRNPAQRDVIYLILALQEAG
jgi:hypothetical protein